MNVKNIVEEIQYQAMWLFVRSIAALPYWVQYYVLEEVLYFVLRYVMRYRRRLILRQLSESFPEKSEREIVAIRNKFYRTLAEQAINTIVLAGMSERERARRVTYSFPKDMEQTIAGRDFVALGAHYSCWEYLANITKWIDDTHHVLAAYHRLRNEASERLFKRLRKTDAIHPVPSHSYMRHYMAHKGGVDGHYLMHGLIADQNVKPYPDPHWYNFLNHETLVFDGGELLANRFHLPAFYFDMYTTRRGYCHCDIIPIYDGESPLERYELTEIYVRRLEQIIHRCPEQWLWSHNRWKVSRKDIPASKRAK